MTEALQLEIRTLRALLDSERDPAGRAFAPLADAHRRAGQIPEALRILRDGIAKHPDFATGHVVAAQLYVEQGLAAEGAIAARRALALDGENVSALRSLLRALEESGEVDGAQEVRSLLTTLEPDFTPDWTTRDATDHVREEPSVAAEPHAALAPTVELRAFESELSVEVPEEVAEDAAAPASSHGGMIDLSKIGFIPSAELPPSALAPDLPKLGSADAPALEEAPPDLELLDLSLPGEDAAAISQRAEPAAEEPVLDLPLLSPEAGEEPAMDLALLAPDVDDEPAMDLALLAPEAEEEPAMDLALLAPDADDEPAMDLALLAPEDAEEAPIDVASLAPAAEDEEPVMDLALLAPDVDETVMDVASLTPAAEDEEPVMDLALLAPDADETVMDVASLAPAAEEDEPAMDLALLAPDADETVMDVASLAPTAEDDEPVMDLALLAPDADETVMDVASLAPAAEDDETVTELALLAPDSADDEPVMDLPLLAPETGAANEMVEEDLRSSRTASVPDSMLPEEEPVFELDALAPGDGEVPATTATGATTPHEGRGNGQMSAEEAEEIGLIAPPDATDEDAMVIDLDALRARPTTVSAGPPPSGPFEVEVSSSDEGAPEPAGSGSGEEAAAASSDSATAAETDVAADDEGEPIFTRTLAELYAAQGATKEAVTVLRHLLSENPGDAGLTRRIAELEAGGTAVRARADEPDDERAERERAADQEVEALARELAESGRRHEEVDSPFGWTDRESAGTTGPSGPTIREYFDGLLGWEPRDS